ncbi:P63C domain-containing protein [Verrucomicrobium sp. BvORR106]|uniref:P63C domain-containing protein n=1 Tax=Verrucomicrobium sp. BvORR106 TaxID=1403819 RepID=UPI002240F869|nr:P63C domain-containing protein [Verrucomicrobium sp. BvORR106]
MLAGISLKMSKHKAAGDGPGENPGESKSIQSKGGRARREKLSPERLKEISSDAAKARWLPKSSHKGNFKKEFGFDVDCYVLNDRSKTPVISQRGMGRALGLSSGGSELPRFLATRAMTKHLGGELGSKLSQPIKFQWIGGGGEGATPGDIHGYDATLLIDLCRVIVQAEQAGDLGPRSKNVAIQAHVILNASAKAGIQGLVYALAGYNPTAAEVIAAFKMYVQEEAKRYEKEFPPELYDQWYRLYDLPVLTNGRPWYFKHFTERHIYRPLAQSNGKILELTRALKANDGDRKKKLFQFLTEIGTRALRMQLGRVLEMAESSKTRAEYEEKIVQRFGGQPDLKIPPSPEEV